MGDKWGQKTKFLIDQLSMCAPNNFRVFVHLFPASIVHLACRDVFALDMRDRSCNPRLKSIRGGPKKVGIVL